MAAENHIRRSYSDPVVKKLLRSEFFFLLIGSGCIMCNIFNSFLFFFRSPPQWRYYLHRDICNTFHNSLDSNCLSWCLRLSAKVESTNLLFTWRFNWGFSFPKLCYQRNNRVIKTSASQVENYHNCDDHIFSSHNTHMFHSFHGYDEFNKLACSQHMGLQSSVGGALQKGERVRL